MFLGYGDIAAVDVAMFLGRGDIAAVHFAAGRRVARPFRRPDVAQDCGRART